MPLNTQNQQVNGVIIYADGTPSPPSLTLQLTSSSQVGMVLTPNSDFLTSQGIAVVRKTGIRQTVLSGSIDALGLPNFITNTGLNFGVNGGATPITLTWANGYGEAGQSDYTGIINQTLPNAWTGLIPGFAVASITRSGTTATVTKATAHNLVSGAIVSITGAVQNDYNVTEVPIVVTGATTFTYTVFNSPVTPATGILACQVNNYLYIDLDINTLALTFGSTVLPPIYDTTPPVTINPGQSWYDMTNMLMKLYNGVTFSNAYRLFVGDFRLSATLVLLSRIYAYQGLYYAKSIAVTNNTQTLVTHNIGSNQDFYDYNGVSTAIISNVTYSAAAFNYLATASGIERGNQNQYAFILQAGVTNAFYMVGSPAVVNPTANVDLVVRRGW